VCEKECDGIFEYADTIAFNRGLKLGLGAIVKFCEEQGDPMWNHLKTFVSHGHEIVCHSYDHGSPIDLGWEPESWSVDTDVVMTKQLIEKNVPGARVTYFIFPFDAYNDRRLNEIKQNGYLGARAGKVMYENDRGIGIDFTSFDPFTSCYFDAYMSKAEQDEIDALPEQERYTVSIYNDDRDDIEIQHVDSAIQTGGWSIQELHSVDDSQPWGWGHISVKKYRNLLDYVRKKQDAGLVWMDTPTSIIKYIMTKNQCGTTVFKDNLVHFSSADSIDKNYATEITLLVTTSGNPPKISGIQNSTRSAATRIGTNRFIMNIEPAKGDVTLAIGE